jgi:transposase
VIVAIESHQGALDMQISTIGLDIAKNVFQVHGIDAAEKVVVRKRLRRRQVLEFFKAVPPCLIGMEACATAHYWARELTKLGHRVRLMPGTMSSARRISRGATSRPSVPARRLNLAHLLQAG